MHHHSLGRDVFGHLTVHQTGKGMEKQNPTESILIRQNKEIDKHLKMYIIHAFVCCFSFSPEKHSKYLVGASKKFAYLNAVLNFTIKSFKVLLLSNSDQH